MTPSARLAALLSLAVDFRDEAAAGAIAPEQLRGYFERHGWASVDLPNWIVWSRPGALLYAPREMGLGYAGSVVQIVNELARHEDRSPLAVYLELAETPAPAQGPAGEAIAPAAWAAMPRGMDAATEHGRAAMIGACALGLFVWLRRLWEATPEGLLAARDAAVATAIADVPEGCDARGWANVVRVIAADNWCGHTERDTRRAQESFSRFFASDLADAAPSISVYARRRFVFGDSRAQALRWVWEYEGGEDVPGALKLAERLFAAYEAGRAG